MLPLIHLNPFKWRMLIRFDYIIFNPNRHGPVEGFSQRMLGRDAPDSAGDAGCSGRILLLSHGIIRVGSGCAGRIAGGGGREGRASVASVASAASMASFSLDGLPLAWSNLLGSRRDLFS